MKAMTYVLLFAIPFLGLAYVLWHVWAVLPFPNYVKGTVVALFVLCFALFFATVSHTIDKMPLHVASVVYEISTSLVIILLYLVIIFLVLDLGRLVRLVPKTWLFHNGWTSLAILLFMLGVFIYGNIHYNHKVRQPLELLTNKPLEKDLKIVLLSDMHLGYHNRRAELARWIDKINAEKPDLVLIAGDIIDISVRPLIEENMAEEFRRIDAPVLACLGNHEYYSGEPEAQRFYREAGIRLLRDSVANVGSSLTIIGRDDRSNPHRRNLAALMKGVDKHKYIILLDHQPFHLEQAERNGVDFQFSGHTHHGQIWPVSWITEGIYEVAFGSHHRGETQYYVSSGLGIWGGKFRIGTRSEYIVATLRR